MKKRIVLLLCILSVIFTACNDKSSKEQGVKSKHHLNIPDNGIQSLMESNTSKIIEGTQGSVVITMGEITRKKADITIRRNDRILDEQLVNEDGKISFEYEGNIYLVVLKSIKKPLIGAGKAEISINLQ